MQLDEYLRIEYAIKRFLPRAIYSFNDGYWNIGLTNEKGLYVRVNSINLSNLNDKDLEMLIKNIGYDLCAKMVCNIRMDKH